jgi:hypothetical protein
MFRGAPDVRSTSRNRNRDTEPNHALRHAEAACLLNAAAIGEKQCDTQRIELSSVSSHESKSPNNVQKMGAHKKKIQYFVGISQKKK